jgi:hypothetical protein
VSEMKLGTCGSEAQHCGSLPPAISAAGQCLGQRRRRAHGGGVAGAAGGGRALRLSLRLQPSAAGADRRAGGVARFCVPPGARDGGADGAAGG